MKKILWIMLIFSMFGCFVIQSSDDEKIIINEDGNIEYKEIMINLKEDADTLTRAVGDNVEFEYNINYIAQVLPVEVDGNIVQANDIVIYDDIAYVAYNYSGDIFSGAIQIIDVSKENKPEIIKEIKFTGIDINALYFDDENDELIFGGAANPDIYDFVDEVNKAVISKLDINNISEDLIFDNMKKLKSDAVTSIVKINNNFYVGVGSNNGGIIELDNNFVENESNFVSDMDIKDIEVLNEELIALSGGSGNNLGKGKLIKNANNISLGDFDGLNHKATLSLLESENKILEDEDAICFVAMSEQGMKVLKLGGVLNRDSIIYSLENPDGEKTNSNSVSYHDGYVFLANGEYGFRVFRVNGITQDENGNEIPLSEGFLDLVGFHSMQGETYDEKNYSANHIVYKNLNKIKKSKNTEEDEEQQLEKNVLFVASGVGGVNIYNLTQNKEYKKNDISKDDYEEFLEYFDDKIETESQFLENDLIIKLNKPAKMEITFIDENAGYLNKLGYYKYNDGETINEESDLDDTKIEIFENASKKNSGGSLEQGYTLEFDVNENIGFYIQTHFNWGNEEIFYTSSKLNWKENNHFAKYYDEENGLIIVCVEDQKNLGDKDYNDLSFMIRINPIDAISNLNEFLKK